MSGALKILQEGLVKARTESSPQQILDLIPYSSFIGAEAKVEGTEVLYWLDRRPSNIGNPSLPAIHGGVIGGFLELSAAIEILYTLDVNEVPKVVDFSLDYTPTALCCVRAASWSMSLSPPGKTVQTHLLPPQDAIF
jgi:hypothetical protein